MNLDHKLERIKEGIVQEMNEKILLIQNEMKKEYAKKEADSLKKIDEEATKIFEGESSCITLEQKRNLSKTLLEQRNKKLRVQAELIEESLAHVRKKLEAIRDRNEYYKELVKALIVEATNQIMDDKLLIFIDERDKNLIDEDFFSSIEIIFTFKGNRSVRYKISDQRIKTAGGVILQAEGKRLSCNNTLEERLEVESRQVKSIISELLLKEGE